MTTEQQTPREDLDALMQQMRGYPPSRVAAVVWDWMGAQGFRDEKAHTPTDDEREALHLIEQAASFREQTNADPEASPNSMVGLWLRTASALEAAVRRSEVPEPSAESPGSQSIAEAVRKMQEAERRPSFDTEPQGEPSDAEADAAQRGYHAFTFGPEEVDIFLTPERLAKGRDAWKAALRAARGVR